MTKAGKTIALFLAVKGGEGRSACEAIHVDAQGILGDKFYGKNLQRSILITSGASSYTLAASKGIEMPYGALGENLVVDIDLYHLTAGAKIRIGEVELEITQNCTLCNSLGKVHPDLPNLLKDDRGIFARALSYGRIERGDSVTLL